MKEFLLPQSPGDESRGQTSNIRRREPHNLLTPLQDRKIGLKRLKTRALHLIYCHL